MSATIRYENTLGDFAAVSKLAEQQQSGWIKLAYDWAFPLGIFVVTVMSSGSSLGSRIAAGLIGAALLRLLLMSPISRWFTYGVLWLHSTFKKGVTGEHRLEVTESGLLEETAHNRTVTPWSKIGPVTTLEPYVMIHVKTLFAHLIPKERILEGDLEPFLEEVRNLAEIKKL